MEEKKKTKKNTAGKKISTGLLFLASLFFAAVILIFTNHDAKTAVIPVIIAGVVMLLSAYLFLNAVFEEKAKEWGKPDDEDEEDDETEKAGKAEEDNFRQQMKEYMESMDRTQKAVFSVMKRTEETTAEQIGRLEQALERIAAQQMAEHKELIKYNKENARQIAVNERETVQNMLEQILKTLKEGTEKEVEALQAVFERGTLLIQETAANEEEPEESADFLKEFGIEPDASVEDFISGLSEGEKPEESQTNAVPEASADNSLEALSSTDVNLSDPNATLTPEDIAKLFAAAGN